MKWVKFRQDLFVEATGIQHKAGDVGEFSEEFAKRHGKEGTGIIEIVAKPKSSVDLQK